jgi:hypothetical protein
MKRLLPQSPSTLQISFPFGQTLLLTALILALLAGGLEALARLTWVDNHVPTAVGSTNRYFDRKIGELDYRSAHAGGVDCIFLGSSLVNSGIDPTIFQAAYREQTGRDIVCYNFGVPGLTMTPAAKLSDLLMKRYHPRLLVYGFTLRALATDPAHRPDELFSGESIFNTPWVRYRRGSLNLEGWLVDHLTFDRRYLALRDWPLYEFGNPIRDLSSQLLTGFMPFTFVPESFIAPEWLKTFTVAPSAWTGLEQIVALGEKTPLLLVEMPLSGQTLDAFKGGKTNYISILDQIDAYASEHGLPLWLTIQLHLIPDNGWAGDADHMNRTGAAVFSRWLGEQIGNATNNGLWPDLTRRHG